ncbi:MAG TPA: NifU family protein [Acidimicrobiales bacterium]|nr:NifU family protein [Acidimicrobiales bacterium]
MAENQTAPAGAGDARTLDALLERLEGVLAAVDDLDDRALVYELLDGIDALHRLALGRLEAALAPETVAGLRADPALAWLLDAYGVGVDERAAADAALDHIRPYLHSHGGEVELLEAGAGTVRVRLTGACSGCTASAVTLQEGIEEALREHFPGFATLEVAEDQGRAHPPPGPTLVEIRRR